MRKVKVITDSCSDLTKELLDKYDMDYACMSINYKGLTIPATLTWDKLTPKEMYDYIREGNRVTTAQVSSEEFTSVFTKYLSQGYDIVYIACASKQSGSVNTGTIVAKNVLPGYPDASIYCIDSLNASFGEGLVAIFAAQLANNGEDAKSVYEKTMAMRNNVVQAVTVHSLEWLRKSGRVSAAKAFFGNLLGKKPLLIADANGTQTPIKKSNGRIGSFKDIVDYVKENALDLENQTIYLAHADCSDEEIAKLKSLITEVTGVTDIYVGYIGPIIGASIGPDAVGIWAYGKEVTYKI